VVNNDNGNGANGLPLVDAPLIIEGNGATLQRDGTAPDFRFFEIKASGDLTLNDLTLQNGQATNGGAINNWGALTVMNSALANNGATEGGGILNNGVLLVQNTSFTGNHAANRGGAIYNTYDGINSDVTVEDSIFDGNTLGVADTPGPTEVYEGGAAVFNMGDAKMTIRRSEFYNHHISGTEGRGGAILVNGYSPNYASVHIYDSTISNNSASYGGGVALIYGELVFENNTVSNNQATGVGDGGGLYLNTSAALTMTNSTISGNSAGDTGGGIYFYWGQINIESSTIAYNSALTGGGLAMNSLNWWDYTNIHRTIFVYNSGDNCLNFDIDGDTLNSG
jgi:predicted outer membrane repeat protein